MKQTREVEEIGLSTLEIDDAVDPAVVENSPSDDSSKPGQEIVSQTNDKFSDPVASAPPKPRRRVLRVEQRGIFTVKTLESVNVVAEWIKALRVSTPYIIHLCKIFWKLSPTRVSILLVANLLKVVIPSVKMWIYKSFLDQVQRVTHGRAAQWKRMLFLAMMGVGLRITAHGLEVAS